MESGQVKTPNNSIKKTWFKVDETKLDYLWLCLYDYIPKKNNKPAFNDFCLKGRFYYVYPKIINNRQRYEIYTTKNSKLEFTLKKSDLFKYFRTWKTDHEQHESELHWKKKYRKRKVVAAKLHKKGE